MKHASDVDTFDPVFRHRAHQLRAHEFQRLIRAAGRLLSRCFEIVRGYPLQASKDIAGVKQAAHGCAYTQHC